MNERAEAWVKGHDVTIWPLTRVQHLLDGALERLANGRSISAIRYETRNDGWYAMADIDVIRQPEMTRS